MNTLKRVTATAMVAAALSVTVAVPSMAMPRERGHSQTIVWTRMPAGWEGRYTSGAYDPLFIYGSPYDYSDYGQTNDDGTIITYDWT